MFSVEKLKINPDGSTRVGVPNLPKGLFANWLSTTQKTFSQKNNFYEWDSGGGGGEEGVGERRLGEDNQQHSEDSLKRLSNL